MEKTKKGNRKWTVTETLRILEYIKERKNFERPTAQVYYNKCLEKTKINAPWNLLRWKLRYLRTTFKKAEDWRRSPEAAQLGRRDVILSVKDKLHKICPHYNILKEIFGTVKNCKINYDSETRSSSISPTPMCNVASDSFTENDYTATDDDVTQFKEEPQDWNSYEITTLPTEAFTTTTFSSAEQEKNFTERFENESKNCSIDHLATIQKEINEIQKIKIELEDKKHEKEIELKEKRLKLEEMNVLEKIARRKQEMEIRQQEIELRKMEMEKDERLRKLEIEKDERLQKYEIEMRYRYAN